MNKTKYAVELFINGKSELLFLNSEREQEIVVKLITDFKNLISTDKENLQQQLQAYKDKEDKLREWLIETIKIWSSGDTDYEDRVAAGHYKKVLQILNKGSDK